MPWVLQAKRPLRPKAVSNVSLTGNPFPQMPGEESANHINAAGARKPRPLSARVRNLRGGKPKADEKVSTSGYSRAPLPNSHSQARALLTKSMKALERARLQQLGLGVHHVPVFGHPDYHRQQNDDDGVKLTAAHTVMAQRATNEQHTSTVTVSPVSSLEPTSDAFKIGQAHSFSQRPQSARPVVRVPVPRQVKRKLVKRRRPLRDKAHRKARAAWLAQEKRKQEERVAMQKKRWLLLKERYHLPEPLSEEAKAKALVERHKEQIAAEAERRRQEREAWLQEEKLKAQKAVNPFVRVVHAAVQHKTQQHDGAEHRLSSPRVSANQPKRFTPSFAAPVAPYGSEKKNSQESSKGVDKKISLVQAKLLSRADKVKAAMARRRASQLQMANAQRAKLQALREAELEREGLRLADAELRKLAVQDAAREKAERKLELQQARLRAAEDARRALELKEKRISVLIDTKTKDRRPSAVPFTPRTEELRAKQRKERELWLATEAANKKKEQEKKQQAAAAMKSKKSPPKKTRKLSPSKEQEAAVKRRVEWLAKEEEKKLAAKKHAQTQREMAMLKKAIEQSSR